MDPKYLPKDIHGIMDHVTEELAEVNIEAGQLVRIIGKFHRFGPLSKEPGVPDAPTNWEHIKRIIPLVHMELNDLFGALVRLEVAIKETEAKEKSDEVSSPTTR